MSVICRSTVGGISVNCRSHIGQLSVAYQSCVNMNDILRAKRNVFQVTGSPIVIWLIVSSIGEVAVECRPSVSQVLAKYRQSVGQVSAKCRPSVGEISVT